MWPGPEAADQTDAEALLTCVVRVLLGLRALPRPNVRASHVRLGFSVTQLSRMRGPVH